MLPFLWDRLPWRIVEIAIALLAMVTALAV